METIRLKRFAADARRVLLQGVSQRLQALGFDLDGQPRELPQQHGGGATFQGDVVSLDFYEKWMKLYAAIRQHSLRDVAEEAAYTWFNRMVCLRIMVKNRLTAPVLEYESSDSRLPMLVADGRQGRKPEIADEQTRLKLNELLRDDRRTPEQFALLITAYCHANPVINACFGQIKDYTELLLPQDILREGGFVDMLNHTDYITDEDFRSPELIGWLYQFYISEKKDEVFASFKKGKKAEAEDIPAATQIFTPNWIVKYMTQNTLGRIYIDNNPYCELKDNLHYLIEGEKRADQPICKYEQLEDLRVADLACGSGHILNECFDLLYSMYMEEGYSRRKAIENIFCHNLTGIDIDTRAKQLATFALLLKACQRDQSFADAHCLPRVLDMPAPYPHKDTLRDTLPHFFMGGNMEIIQEVCDAIGLMDEADNLGSIMKFDISERTRNAILVRMEEYRAEKFVPEPIRELMPYMDVILALTEKYHSLIANPPYMKNGNMNVSLSSYLSIYYPTTKFDLFSVFMEMMINKTIEGGRTAFITMESWMFLLSFEQFRRNLLSNYFISSLSHFGWYMIGIAFGTAMTVIEKSQPNGRFGEYSYLTIDDMDNERNHPLVFPKKDNGRYATISQRDFETIPGNPIGYWVSERFRAMFRNKTLKDIAEPKAGLATGDNNRFQRLWYEVSMNKIGRDYTSTIETSNGKHRWFPCLSGGTARKWEDFIEYVVNWENDGEVLKKFRNNHGKLAARPQNTDSYFKEGLTWNKISSKHFLVRHKNKGSIFDDTSRCAFLSNEINLYYLIGLLGSTVSNNVLKFFNPTLSFTNGDISRIPIIGEKDDFIDFLVQENIAISKADWDAHETSWDFQRSPLLERMSDCGQNVADIDMLDEDEAAEMMADPNIPTNQHRLSDVVLAYKHHWERQFYRLHRNEEELNRRFIEIYGLQDELTPDVPLSEITILQQGEISIEDN